MEFPRKTSIGRNHARSANKRPRTPKTRHGDCDPEFEFFLDHLRADGKSYAFEMADEGSGLITRVKYESEEEEEDSGSNDGNPSSDRRSCGKISRNKKCLKVDEKRSRKRCRSPDWKEFLDDCEFVDENYRFFLDRLKLRAGTMVLELDNNVIIKYEGGDEEEETVNETEGSVTGSNFSSTEGESRSHRGSPRPSSPNGREVDGSFLQEMESYRVPSPFKKRLMEALRKPYNRREYDEMMRRATTQPSKEKYRELRRRCKRYTTDERGSSYFDFYPDLADQIKSADRYKGLTLLRAFFFWLENLAHDGAFKPWVLRTSGLEALPSCSHS